MPGSLWRNAAGREQAGAAGAGKVFREVASGAKTDRTQLRRALAQIATGDVLKVTRLDRLARSTRDLLNSPGGIAELKAVTALSVTTPRPIP
jgi:DNA invertase Pin-like site-specific DNA recombinase